MTDHQGSGDRGRGGGQAGGRSATIGLSQISDSGDFELVHPRCVLQRRPDYEEGISLWQSGDPEGARDALRYALEGCGNNLWVHVALGRIALEWDEDFSLARGHFGYAFELVERALPRSFQGRLSRKIPGNKPFYEAAEGLAACYEGLGKKGEAMRIRSQAERLGRSQS